MAAFTPGSRDDKFRNLSPQLQKFYDPFPPKRLLVPTRMSPGAGPARTSALFPPIPNGPGGPVSSAGVFDATDLLIRTIWSSVTNAPNVSTPILAWDGAKDDGTVAPTGSYRIKVVSHNINYHWDIANGPIGNSSSAVHDGTNSAANLGFWNHGGGWYNFAITTAGQIWTALGYNEKYTNLAVSSRTNIQAMTYFTSTTPSIQVFNTENNQTYVATDDTRVYVVLWISGQSGIYAIDIASNTLIDPNHVGWPGGPALSIIGPYSVVGFDNTGTNFPTGLDVQRTGSFLFLSRSQANSILTLNKTSGVTLVTNTPGLVNPTQLAANPTNATELWVVTDGQTMVRKLAVDGTGHITLAGVNLSFPAGTGAGPIVAIAVAPSGTQLLVALGWKNFDPLVGGDHQLRAFNTSDGSAQTAWANSGIFGRLGGYNSTSVVDNNTFFLASQSVFGGSSNCFISFDPSDGSFWLGDKGNWRALHFTAGNSPTFIEAIYAIGGFYGTFACMNDPTKVTTMFNVYTCDLSKTLQYGNGSWTLTNDYGGKNFGGSFNPFTGGRFFIKASNGRYYMTPGSGYNVMSLDDGGKSWIDTGLTIEPDTYIDHNFNLWKRDNITPDGVTSCTIRRNLFTSFSGTTPIWALPSAPNTNWPAFLTFTPPAGFPKTGGDNNFYWPEEILNNGVIPMFDPTTGAQNHLGGIDSVTGAVKFNTMFEAPTNFGANAFSSNVYVYPEAPFFDRTGNPNPGGQLFATAGQNHFFTQMRGEQTNGGQTNVIHHWHQSGLILNRFGAAAPIFAMESLQAPLGSSTGANFKGLPGLTGNSAFGGAEQDPTTGNWYLYEGDEWYQGGITRWTISNVSTIRVDEFPVSWNAANFPANLDPTDLMYGTIYNGSLVDGAVGWHRNPATDINNVNGDYFRCGTNVNNCSRTSPSITLNYFMNVAGLDGYVYRDIPRVKTGNWQISAVEAIFPSNIAGGIWLYTEVADNAGKVLVRIWQDIVGANSGLQVNGSLITPRILTADFEVLAQDRTPLTIAGNVGTGMLTVTWSKNNYTITVAPNDVGGNVGAPSRFRFTCHMAAGSGSGNNAALFSLHYTES